MTICGSVIKPAASVKILGVTVDARLSWEAHIRSSLLLRVERAQRTGASPVLQNLPNIGRGFGIPRCEVFSLCVWKLHYNLAAARSKTLNFTASIVTNSGRCDRVTPIFHQLKWLRVPEMIHERDIMMMRALLCPAPSSVPRPFLSRSNRRLSAAPMCRTAQPAPVILQAPRVRAELCHRSFFPRAIRAWNGLPLEIRTVVVRETAFRSAAIAHLTCLP